MRSMRATQPSTPPSNVRVPSAGAAPGMSKPRKVGSNGKYKVGQEVYLWILIVIEIFAIGGFRRFFRKVHGG